MLQFHLQEPFFIISETACVEVGAKMKVWLGMDLFTLIPSELCFKNILKKIP